MIIDQEQRDLVLDVTQSFLVQAPAGSGKTSLLVQRYLSLLACVQKEPEEIVALTFTRKAAAEMRDRIIDALILGQEDQAPLDPYRHKLWYLARKVLQRDQQAAWNLIFNPSRLKIQTIDALCSSITGQMPIVSRFGAQPQPEPNAEQLYMQAIDQLLLNDADNEFWQPALNTLLAHLDNDRAKFKNLLYRMLAIREQWLPLFALNQSSVEFKEILENSLLAVVEQALEKLHATMPDDFDASVFVEDFPTTMHDWLILAEKLLTEKDEWRKQVTKRQGFLPPSGSKDKEEKEFLKARKEAAEQMLRVLSAYPSFKQQLVHMRVIPPVQYTDAQWNIIEALTKLLPVLIAQLTLVFKDHGQVDFSEVALSSLSALGHADAPSELSLALDCKIQHILVDEFQDTSFTQYKLLEILTANWEANADKTLFLVGDPMQSIYRFRKAEVGLFLRAKDSGINAIKLNFVQLKVNFRSFAPIVSWVNRTFRTSFPASDDMLLGAISYMPAHAAKEEQYGSAVECHAIGSAQQDQKIIDLITCERVRDPAQTMAILVRSKSHVQTLLPALRTAGIVYQAVDIESLAERSLIQDLCSLTRALLHLDDRIVWLGLLRAPWCGLSLADLDLLAQGATTIAAAMQDKCILAQMTDDARMRLDHVQQVMLGAIAELGRQPFSVLVQTTWVNLGGNLCLRNPEAQQEAQAYFGLLAKLALQREIFQVGYLEQQLDKLFLPAATMDSNAVQIMTMHKAKGLEFDVVILPHLDKPVRANDQQLLLMEQRAQDHLLLAPIKAATQQEDAIYAYLAWCEQQREDFEAVRLMYVATTRAKRKIYCLAELHEPAPRSNSMLGKIWSALQDEFVSVDAAIVEQPDLKQRSIVRLPSQWLIEHKYEPKSIATIIRQNQTLTDYWQRLAGIVLHRTLWQITTSGVEQWDHERIKAHRLVWENALQQLSIVPEHLPGALKLIEQAVSNTLADPWGRTILSNKHVESYAEWRLTTYEHNEFKQMILDRAFLDQDGKFWIVDYKLIADQEELPTAIASYAAQLQKYTKIVQRMKPQQEIISGLYFPLQGCWQQIVATKADLNYASPPVS